MAPALKTKCPVSMAVFVYDVMARKASVLCSFFCLSQLNLHQGRMGAKDIQCHRYHRDERYVSGKSWDWDFEWALGCILRLQMESIQKSFGLSFCFVLIDIILCLHLFITLLKLFFSLFGFKGLSINDVTQDGGKGSKISSKHTFMDSPQKCMH